MNTVDTSVTPENWTAEELAAFLRVSLGTVDRMHAAGRLPFCTYVGRSRRWPAQEIREWYASRDVAGRLPTSEEWEAMKHAKAKKGARR